MPTDTHAALAPASAAPMVPVRYRVVRRDEETADAVTLSLTPVDGPIGEPQPGQFTMLYAFGVGEVPISVSGCPGAEGELRHTIRAVGATTRALCRSRPGEMVGVRGPFGSGWPSPASGSDVVIVAGGIGLAPLRPLVHQLLANRELLGHIAVLVGARTPDDLLFGGESDEWRSELHVAVTVDAARRGWHGDVGVVSTLVDRLPFSAAGATAYVCGPEVMMRVVARRLLDAGTEAHRVFVSLERNMHCAVRLCGHCQLGPLFVCTDGPVVSWAAAEPLLSVRRW